MFTTGQGSLVFHDMALSLENVCLLLRDTAVSFYSNSYKHVHLNESRR